MRQTRGQIDQHLRAVDPRRREDIARDLATRIREQADRVKCVQCGGPTVTDNRYRCEACRFTFDGPAHMPDPGA